MILEFHLSDVIVNIEFGVLLHHNQNIIINAKK